MLKESLIIRNFGPLVDVCIPCIKQFNVFIGESGSGKSTIMKVLAMMRWIFKMSCIRSYLKRSGIQSPFRFRIDSLLGENGLKYLLRPESEIVYSNGTFEIIIRNKKIILPHRDVAEDELTLQKIAYISDKRVVIPDLAAGNVAIRHNMFYLDETLLNYQKALDAISSTDLNYLGVTMTVKKTNSGRRVFVSSLGENLAFDNLPLTSASSGMQSSVALHFITNYFSHHYDIVEAMNSTVVKFLAAGDNLSKFSTSSDIGSFPHRKISVHLEEPELSLFPSNQWGLMKYLVGECLTAEKAEMDLTVATHSPYILTAINIMMLAKKASMRDEKRFLALNLPIPLLDTDKVGAWSVAEGKCTSLFDPELGMIDGTFLDHVSDEYEDLILRLNDIIYE